MATTEKHEFQTEVRQLLDLMIHSLYSRPEIFLRELISNASDALDKRRFEALTDEKLQADGELGIRIEVDAAARTLAVVDNGIGMTRDEVVSNLGTIARSGTGEFLEVLRQRGSEGELPPELIGQFGVGFYSSFMAADRVDVVTRRAGEEGATAWTSEGDGFSVEAAERDVAGTTVTLRLKEASEDDGLADFTTEHVIRDVVKRYSDFVAYPIRLVVSGKDEPREDDDSEDGDAKDADAEPPALNSQKALWTRPPEEITEEEHVEFYRHVSHDWADPLLSIPVKIEGSLEARALLYVPSQAPIDLYWQQQTRRGVHLYVKRVFIMDDCQELLPEYLRFVRGVVDSEDLSLNVSREILQQDRQVRAMRKFLVRKLLERLEELKADDREKYDTFWTQFGPVLKEGLIGFESDRDRLAKLVLTESTREEEGRTTLAEYVERMPEGQDTVYYITGRARETVERSPHLEAFRERGHEVLFFTDPVDELWLQNPPEIEGKKLQSVGKGEVELGTEEEREAASKEKEELAEKLEGLMKAMGDHLDEEVKEVRLSTRLRSSPACLVGDAEDMSPAVQEMMRKMGQDVPAPKRILELNADHEFVRRLENLHGAQPDDPLVSAGARVLHDQALIAEGGKPSDPARFSEALGTLLVNALPKDGEGEG